MTMLTDVSVPRIVSRDEWLAARTQLLAEEKQWTRATDALAARRRALPMVELAKPYTFTGPQGTISLGDLLDGRQQLITYHYMSRPEPDEGCPSCSFAVDNLGNLTHLHACDTTLALISRAPWPSIQRFRQRMGWPLPWYSSADSDFNDDFGASTPDTDPTRDVAGLSVFLRDGQRIFHTYSTYQRGIEAVLGTLHCLDLTPRGRQRHLRDFPYHDQYPHATQTGSPPVCCQHEGCPCR